MSAATTNRLSTLALSAIRIDGGTQTRAKDRLPPPGRDNEEDMDKAAE